MKRPVTTWHLELLSRSALKAPTRIKPEYLLLKSGLPCPEWNRFLYTAVGGDWYWVNRLSWTFDRWMEWLDRPEVETWAGFLDGTPFGYFELECQPEGNVEIAYFGLLPAFTSMGFGGHLLTDAARRAWDLGARRVWVHTCSCDHPNALANYQSRGFQLFMTDEAFEDLPDETPGPWPNCRR